MLVVNNILKFQRKDLEIYGTYETLYIIRRNMYITER